MEGLSLSLDLSRFFLERLNVTPRIGPYVSWCEVQEIRGQKRGDVEISKGRWVQGASFYKERAVRESDGLFHRVNKEIYKVTNLGI